MKPNSVKECCRVVPKLIDKTLDPVPIWLGKAWAPFSQWFIEFWNRRLLPVLVVLFYCRFSVAVVAIAAGLLWFSEQGREIAVRVGDSLTQTLLAVVSTFFWAFHSWFDGRRVLEKRFPDKQNESFQKWDSYFELLVKLTPRLIGSTAYLIAASSAFIAWKKLNFQNGGWSGLLLVLDLVLAYGFYQLMAQREKLQQRLFSEEHQQNSLDFIRSVTIPFTWFYGSLLFLAATFFPVFLGFNVGSLAIVFFALSTIVSFGSWLILETTTADKPSAFPVISALFILAVVLTFWPYNDNHRIPTLPPLNQRPDVAEAFQTWSEQAPVVDGAKPMVFVATAGGGIRAAYWTVSVLGQVTDAQPQFRNSLFAISGVSGGSVGAAVYAASLREKGSSCAQSAGTACLSGLALKALSQEFLAPVLARMFYPDLIQRFLPIAVLPDRAASLSSAWQTQWEYAVGKPQTAGLDAPLTSLKANGQDWLPVLLLNSTHVETGERVIASNLALDNAKRPNGQRAFLNATDLTALLQADVTLGTAALNSARFTYVSPPGTLPCAGSSWASFCRNGHVVDGGYFENFGAVTAKQLFDAVPRADASIRPLMILISNDNALGNRIEDDTPPTSLPTQGVANETIAPVRALLNTRESRGMLAAKDYRTAVPEKDFFHFRMELEVGQAEPALGWVLSRSSESLLRNMLCRPHNLREFGRLLNALGVADGQAKAAESCRNR